MSYDEISFVKSLKLNSVLKSRSPLDFPFLYWHIIKYVLGINVNDNDRVTKL